MKLQASVSSFTKKETLSPVFSYGFCEIFKNNIFTEQLRATISEKTLSFLTDSNYTLNSKSCQMFFFDIDQVIEFISFCVVCNLLFSVVFIDSVVQICYSSFCANIFLGV